jgi:uncharacterized protein (TIGR03086 family)
MADLVQLFRRSTDRFGELVGSVPAKAWGDPTPCADWDVRELVNHVVGEQLWAPHLVAGETIADVGDRYDGDVLGDDPTAAWAAAIGPSVRAFEGADLGGTVHLSYGDEKTEEYLVQMLTDAAVHGWDLARAIGADEAIDEETARLLLEHWTALEAMVRGSGVFGDQVDVPSDAPAKDKLLGLLGRTP